MIANKNLLSLLSAAALVAGCRKEQASSQPTETIVAQTTVAAPLSNKNVAAQNVEFTKFSGHAANDALPAQKIEFSDITAQGTNDPTVKQTSEFSEKSPRTDLENGLSAIGR